jgi:serine/threonine-protein kinase BUR1
LKHPYFRNDPLPAQPGSLPTFEESHELDRRKFRGQKAAPPPAPKGGTVGMGPTGGWGGDGGGGGNSGFGDNYGGVNRAHHNSNRHPNLVYGGYRAEAPPAPLQERRPAWQRDTRPDTRLPPRPPPANNALNWGGGFDGARSERPDYRDRDRERPLPRSRGGGGGDGNAASRNIDTYIPSYGPDSGRREERPRDERRRWDDRDDRRHDRDRDRLDYDDQGRNGRTRSRSRSPVRDRERERIRERDPLSRERDVYRR